MARFTARSVREAAAEGVARAAELISTMTPVPTAVLSLRGVPLVGRLIPAIAVGDWLNRGKTANPEMECRAEFMMPWHGKSRGGAPTPVGSAQERSERLSVVNTALV